ncbi:MAG: glycoside hydrolase family 3 N-terminal domain-containing protein [Bacteroidota bacterium]
MKVLCLVASLICALMAPLAPQVTTGAGYAGGLSASAVHPSSGEVFACEPAKRGNGLDESDPWVLSTLHQLSLEEKVAQMVMPATNGVFMNEQSDSYQRLVHLVRDRHVGGIIFFQGEVFETAMLINKLQSLARVPLLISADFEWGPGMRIHRSTTFPPAMAIAATRNPIYAYKVGEATAQEGRALGIHQNYAPVVDINSNPENPIINIRAFSDNKEIVSRFAKAFIEGTQKGGMLATAKHFPGHGATSIDSHAELPVLHLNRRELESVELAPFRSAIRSGVLSIMVGHLALPSIDTVAGLPSTLSKNVITGLLRDEMGFKGLIVTDAMSMGGVTKMYSTAEAAVKAVQAGVDMVLLSPEDDRAIDAIIAAVRLGMIPETRIDESVKRILAAKKWLGLDKEREVRYDDLFREVAVRRHQLLSEEIARNAVTIVKLENPALSSGLDGRVLPLESAKAASKPIALLSISDSPPGQNTNAGDLFISEVRSRYNNLLVGKVDLQTTSEEMQQLQDMARNADLLLIPVYVKIRAGKGTISLPMNAKKFIKMVLSLHKPVVIVSFGNPYILSDFPQVNAYIAAYSDADVMVRAAAQVLFGEAASTGTLPISIPGVAKFGEGVKLPQVNLRFDAPEVAGFDREKLGRINEIVTKAIQDSAFPAAEVVVVRNNIVAFHKAFGSYDYSLFSREIDESTMFDLASLTKVIATTSAVMKLYDEKKIDLDAPVVKYIPEFGQNGKEHVTIRNLLLHNSGLPAWKKFYLTCTTPQQLIDSVYAQPLIYRTGDSTVYSDLGFITLGKVVEKITGVPLDQYVAKEFFEPLYMAHTMFNPPKSIWDRVAPTEYDTVLRHELVRGVVHDENAYVLGGVSGHAGLFSTALDLAKFMQMLMNGGSYGGRRYFNESTVKLFTTRQSKSSTRALGWDTKSAVGSLAGTLFSPNSFGHTGFTGTMIWADPERNLFAIFLTNRVYPTRDNAKIQQVRPKLYDAVIEALETDLPSGANENSQDKN